MHRPSRSHRLGVSRLIQTARVLAIAVIAAGFAFEDARADGCSSVVPGASSGAAPWAADPSDSFFRQPLCYVDYGGGGGSVRQEFEQKCRAVPGYIQFNGDYGSNHNTCYFRPASDGAQTGSRAAPQACHLSDMAPTNNPALISAIVADDYQKGLSVLQGERAEVETSAICTDRIQARLAQLDCIEKAFKTLISGDDSEVLQINVRSCPAYYFNTGGYMAAAAARYDRALASSRPRATATSQAAADPDARPGDRYSALVLTPDGKWFGTSRNKASPQEAIDEARDVCAASERNTITTGMGSGPACSKQIWVKNGCISMARTNRWATDGNWSASGRDTKALSDAAALASCRSKSGNSCEFVPEANTCSTDVRPIEQPQSPPKPAEQPSAGAGNAKFRVCNQDGQKVFVSLITAKGGRWSVDGWYSVNDRTCRDIFVSAGTFYWHIASAGAGHWGGTDLRQCVTPSRPFGHAVRQGGCGGGEIMADFKAQTIAANTAFELHLSR